MQEEQATLSALLACLSARATRPLSIAAIIDHFGKRSFGGALFTCALLNLLPLPPGSSTLLGLPLLLIAPQLALGARRPWLPRGLAERTVDPKLLATGCRGAIHWVGKIEAVTTRRWAFMFGRLGDVLLGAVSTLLAAVLILPIPLGNLLPSMAILVLALSLIQRDGLLAIAGYLVAGLSAAVLVVSWRLVAAAVAHLGAWLGFW